MGDLSVKPTPSGFFAVFRGTERISRTYISLVAAQHQLTLVMKRESVPTHRREGATPKGLV